MPMLTKNMIHGNQYWTYQTVHKLKKKTVRITIRAASSHDISFQSAEVFDGDKWNTIISYPINHRANFSRDLYVMTEDKLPMNEFTNAEKRLLAEVETILM
jgi:hypothetical protein